MFFWFVTVDPIDAASFKSIIGRRVCAKLAQLRVQIADDTLSTDDYVALVFDVCSDLNETCILSISVYAATVHRQLYTTLRCLWIGIIVQLPRQVSRIR